MYADYPLYVTGMTFSCLSLSAKRLKLVYSCLWEPIAEMRNVTCRMGSPVSGNNLLPDTGEHALL